MREFQFTANTPSGERATAIAGGATLVGVMRFNVRHFRSAVARSFAESCAFSGRRRCAGDRGIFDRRGEHAAFDLGEYTLRLDGRHLTVICPNQTVIDLGEVQRTAIDRHKGDGKCADFAIAGSKDQIRLRLRNATEWNGQSKSAISAILRRQQPPSKTRSFTSTAHKGDSACNQLFTDTSANLPTAYCRAHNIHVIPLYYYIDGEEHTCLDTAAFEDTAYYTAMKEGKAVTTSQITPGNFIQAFRPCARARKDIIYVCMARRISGSYDSAASARDELLAEFPERRIALINTRGAGFGEGIPSYGLRRARDAGADFDAAVAAGERCGYIYQVSPSTISCIRRTGRCSIQRLGWQRAE